MKNLKEMLKEQGKKQRELASYLKVTESTISKYTKTERQMSYEQLCKTADFLSVSIDKLLDHETFTPKILFQKPPKPKNTVITYDKYGNKAEFVLKETDLQSITTLLNSLALSQKI